MSNMLLLFTLISVLLIILIPPVSLAKSVDTLNRKSSKLCYIPVLNEIRAELIYNGKFGLIGISWILLIVMLIGSYVTMYTMYGTVVYIIFHYGFFAAIGFWYLAKVLFIWKINTQLRLQPIGMIIVQSIIYPWGYSMLKTLCNLFRSMHKEG